MKIWRNYKAETIIGLVGLLGASGIFVVNSIRGFSDKEGEFLEHFGAFIGGYMGALFSLGAMLLLFATLKAQRETSEDQNFETKYFELLKLHRENVAEMHLYTGESGRRLFLLFVGEVRNALRVIASLTESTGISVDQETRLQAAYYVMFYGVGPNSSRMLANALNGLRLEADLTGSIVAVFENVRNASQSPVTPFDGHQSRLGHYYRHLYQMIRYVDQQTIATLDDAKKYEYVKTVRAQLSTHEQALLLLNSLTPMGRNWWSKGLIERYRLVQNIPEGFFDPESEIDIVSMFRADYFEWQEAS